MQPYKAVVSQKVWDKAVAEVRTQRANQLSLWDDPPLELIQHYVERVEYITPVPYPEEIITVGGRGSKWLIQEGYHNCYFTVALDKDGKLTKVEFRDDYPVIRHFLCVVGTVRDNKLVTIKGPEYSEYLYASTLLARLLGAEFVVEGQSVEQ